MIKADGANIQSPVDEFGYSPTGRATSRLTLRPLYNFHEKRIKRKEKARQTTGLADVVCTFVNTTTGVHFKRPRRGSLTAPTSSNDDSYAELFWICYRWRDIALLHKSCISK